MSNVLLVDTNFSSNPIYQFLVREGHDVTVVGNNPDDCLVDNAQKYIQRDYSDVGEMRELLAHYEFDYLVPGSNDLSYMICSAINQDGRFPGIDKLDTAEIINNKARFREFARNNDLPVPQVLAIGELGTRWPVIVKPTDAFSGRGVTIVNEDTAGEIRVAIEHARNSSMSGTFVVEDYVEGELFSHTAFIKDGSIITDYLVEEHCTANRFVVDTSRVVYDFPSRILSKIRENINFVAHKLNLVDGLIHTQFIYDGDQHWIIEITRRNPGDLYSQLIELSTGFRYADNYTRGFLGEDIHLESSMENRWIMRHTLTQKTDYLLGSIEFKLPLKFVKWVPLSRTGKNFEASPNGRAAVFFVEEASKELINEVFVKTLRRELYEISA